MLIWLFQLRLMEFIFLLTIKIFSFKLKKISYEIIGSAHNTKEIALKKNRVVLLFYIQNYSK